MSTDLRVEHVMADRLTGTEALEGLVKMMLTNSEIDQSRFVRGVGMGVEGAAYAERDEENWTKFTSPLEDVTSHPAWFAGYRRTHDLSFSIGAVLGSFSERMRFDIHDYIEQQIEGAAQ